MKLIDLPIFSKYRFPDDTVILDADSHFDILMQEHRRRIKGTRQDEIIDTEFEDNDYVIIRYKATMYVSVYRVPKGSLEMPTTSFISDGAVKKEIK